MKTLSNPSDFADLRQRLQQLRPNSPRRWGKMTSHQMLCHLHDSMLVALGEKTASPVSPPVPRPIYKFAAFYIPLRWPRNISTRPEIDQLLDGTPPVEFTADLQKFDTALERFVANPRDFQFGTHPMFGDMSEKHWMRWAYLHADHHLRQFGV